MMTITAPPEIEAALVEQAHRLETTPEKLALDLLRERLLPQSVEEVTRPQNHEEWVALLRDLGKDCGVSPSNEALSSEGLYD